MTGSLSMSLLNMAILGRAAIFPLPHYPSDSHKSRNVQFPDVFDGQKSFNSVYLVNNRRYSSEYQIGRDLKQLDYLWECASKCYKKPECFFFSAMVQSFGDENGDALDKFGDDVNCILIDQFTSSIDGIPPLTLNTRRWVAGQMPARHGAKALSKGIEDWTESYPDNIGLYDHVDDFSENSTGKFIYLRNFMSAWSWGAENNLMGKYYTEVQASGPAGMNLGECFDECLKRPKECNAISHGLTLSLYDSTHKDECFLVYVRPYLSGGPHFEDLDVSAHHSKHDAKCWQPHHLREGHAFNTWRVVPRSEDFPLYGSNESPVSPWEEHRPDIVPEDWSSQTLSLISGNRSLLNAVVSYPCEKMEDCAKDCVLSWDDHKEMCRFFSFDKKNGMCQHHVNDVVNMKEEPGNFISVRFEGLPSHRMPSTNN